MDSRLESSMEFQQGKLFVGGLSRETREEELENHFSKYGEVKEALVIFDRVTGISRGFGFVSFADTSMAHRALQDEHVILGRKVDAKPAKVKTRNQQIDRSDEDANNPNQFRTKKIFVGGLPPNITQEEFKNFFDRFGTTTDVVVILNKVTGRPRGFGFVTFDSEDSVDAVLQNKHHTLNDYRVEVKRAIPKVETERDDAHNVGYVYGYYYCDQHCWCVYPNYPYCFCHICGAIII